MFNNNQSFQELKLLVQNLSAKELNSFMQPDDDPGALNPFPKVPTTINPGAIDNKDNNNLQIRRVSSQGITEEHAKLRNLINDESIFILTDFIREFKTLKLTPAELCLHKSTYSIELRSQIYDQDPCQAPWNRKSDIVRETTLQQYVNYQQNFQSPTNGRIQFGTNVQLNKDPTEQSYFHDWLSTIPIDLQPNGDKDFLSKLGWKIDGINNPQVYLKVNGAFTCVHTENLNLVSINVNGGPRSSTWFAIPRDHNPKFLEYLKAKGVQNLGHVDKGTFWPQVKELKDNGIPVYHFEQKEGETVVVGPGTFHWVQAAGSSIHVSWNIGVTSKTQLEYMYSRYKYNSCHNCNSNIPFMHLMWSAAEDSVFLSKLDNQCIDTLSNILTLSAVRRCAIERTLAGLAMLPPESIPKERWFTCDICNVELEHYAFLVHNSKKAKEICFHCWKCPENKNKFIVKEVQTLTEDLTIATSLDNLRYAMAKCKNGFVCKICMYGTDRKYNYDRHLISHQTRENATIIHRGPYPKKSRTQV